MRPFREWPFRRIDHIFVRFGEHGGLAMDIAVCPPFSMSLSMVSEALDSQKL